MILCHNGVEARQAVQIICERSIQPGILALDQRMPVLKGMDIFKEFREKMPPRLTRVLQSSRTHKDIQTHLVAGTLDASIGRFYDDVLPALLKIYLRKTFQRPKGPK